MAITTVQQIADGLVLKGAELLDAHFGNDWPNLIDLDTLDMSDTRCCVLGQLDGEIVNLDRCYKSLSPYSNCAERLGIYTDDHSGYYDNTSEYGFDWSYQDVADFPEAASFGICGVIAVDYSTLRFAWVDYITARRGA